MIKGYAAQSKSFQTEIHKNSGGTNIFLAGKCTDDFIDVSRSNKDISTKQKYWFKALLQSFQFMTCNIT